MREKPARVSKAEWEIMEVLWRRAPLSATETFENLGSGSSWHIKTVRTLLDRLVRKGVVDKPKVHGIYVFSPIASREQCLHEEGSSFLSRFFRGDPVSMIAHFIEHEDLSEDEMCALRQLLETKSPAPKEKS